MRYYTAWREKHGFTALLATAYVYVMHPLVPSLPVMRNYLRRTLGPARLLPAVLAVFRNGAV